MIYDRNGRGDPHRRYHVHIRLHPPLHLSISIYDTAPTTGMDSRAQEIVGSPEARTTHRCYHQEGETCQDDPSVHWRKCYSTLTEYDSKVVSSWTEEMNTTLIFVSASILSTASISALTDVS